MKWIFAAVLAACAVAPVQAQSVRHGTIVDMKPIDNRGDDESAEHKQAVKQGSTLGAMVGLFGGSKISGGSGLVTQTAGTVASGVGGKVMGDAVGEGPAAHYMVKVQTDDGRIVTLVQPGSAVQGLHAGSKVAMSGQGAGATLAAE
jgi:outer membrane lipoprotein SlyB